MIGKYQKKPITIQAMKYTFDNLNDIVNFAGEENCIWSPTEEKLSLSTLEGPMEVLNGAYVIRGVKGEFYPCRGDIFEETYIKI